MKKIYCVLDAIKGLHFDFGEEVKGLLNFLKEQEDCELVEMSVGSCTLLLALDIYCEQHNIELQVYKKDGTPFQTVTEAHKFASDEYIDLDLFGIKEKEL